MRTLFLMLFCILNCPLGLSEHIFTEPTTESQLAGTVNRGQALVIIEKYKNWAKILNPETGEVGWIDYDDYRQD